MKLAPYPKYKPSGVERLGNVPEGWNVRQLKYAASINDETLPETTDPAFAMSYVDIGSVDAIEGIVGVEEMTFESAPSRARRIVRDGDTVVSTVRTYLKAIAYIRESKANTVVSTGFAVIRPRTTNPAFLSYAMRETGFVETVVARSVGVSYPAVNASEIGSLEIPLPSHEEQCAIADFLDRQTVKIDTLIRKKQTLIERLQEKRAALITRTVTRGLPPDAARAAGLEPEPQMKASGVEWLGEVPAHWEVMKVRNLVSLVEEKKSEANGKNRLPYIGLEHIESWTGRLCALDSEFVPTSIANRFHSRDVLFGKLRPYLAKACKPSFEGVCSSELLVLRLNSRIEGRFLLHLLLTRGFISLVDSSTYGAKMPRANWNDVSSCVLPVPPLKEQRAIADFLDRETAKIDGLIAKVDTAIARLREYRTALITAAVTGQVDVRGVVVVDATATSKHNRKV